MVYPRESYWVKMMSPASISWRKLGVINTIPYQLRLYQDQGHTTIFHFPVTTWRIDATMQGRNRIPYKVKNNLILLLTSSHIRMTLSCLWLLSVYKYDIFLPAFLSVTFRCTYIRRKYWIHFSFRISFFLLPYRTTINKLFLRRIYYYIYFKQLLLPFVVYGLDISTITAEIVWQKDNWGSRKSNSTWKRTMTSSKLLNF